MSMTHDEIAQQLEERFAVVGITEEYLKFMFYLHKVFRLPLCLFNNLVVRPERASFKLDQEELDLIRVANFVDMHLYRIVRHSFENKFHSAMTLKDLEICSKYEKCSKLFAVLTNCYYGQRICVSRAPITAALINRYRRRLAIWNAMTE